MGLGGLAPDTVVCPGCRYLLYPYRPPMRCSECGVSVDSGLAAGLLTWERDATRGARAARRTAWNLLCRPREAMIRLRERSSYGVFGARRLLGYWIAAQVVLPIIFGWMWLIAAVWSFDIKHGCFPRSETWEAIVPHRDPIVWFLVRAVLPWSILWLVATMTVAWSTMRTAILRPMSTLVLLGPITLLCQTVTCLFLAADRLLPEEYRWYFPQLEVVGGAVLFGAFAWYSYELATKCSSTSQDRRWSSH